MQCIRPVPELGIWEREDRARKIIKKGDWKKHKYALFLCWLLLSFFWIIIISLCFFFFFTYPTSVEHIALDWEIDF